MINIAIADDHPLMREGIKKVIGNEIDMRVVGEANDGNSVMTLLENTRPDILVLDMTMPGNCGLELIKQIKKLYPNLHILILSIHPADRFALRAFKAGVQGYMCKSCISDSLISALRKIVIQKRTYISTEIAELMAHQLGQGNHPLHESLSDREFEIMRMIAAGQSCSEIASHLSLSIHTVNTYRSRIKEKMNLSTNVEMAHYAIEFELI